VLAEHAEDAVVLLLGAQRVAQAPLDARGDDGGDDAAGEQQAGAGEVGGEGGDRVVRVRLAEEGGEGGVLDGADDRGEQREARLEAQDGQDEQQGVEQDRRGGQRELRVEQAGGGEEDEARDAGLDRGVEVARAGRDPRAGGQAPEGVADRQLVAEEGELDRDEPPRREVAGERGAELEGEVADQQLEQEDEQEDDDDVDAQPLAGDRLLRPQLLEGARRGTDAITRPRGRAAPV
jgi:hypothetical protein